MAQWSERCALKARAWIIGFKRVLSLIQTARFCPSGRSAPTLFKSSEAKPSRLGGLTPRAEILVWSGLLYTVQNGGTLVDPGLRRAFFGQTPQPWILAKRIGLLISGNILSSSRVMDPGVKLFSADPSRFIATPEALRCSRLRPAPEKMPDQAESELEKRKKKQSNGQTTHI